MSDNIFKAPCCDETAQQLADSMPKGRAWGQKNVLTSNVRRLINCLSVVYQRVQQQIEHLDDEYRIGQTYDLLRDWETSVGIPGECLGTAETLAQRRQAVIDRLKRTPIVTIDEMQTYVNNLFPGYGITLYPGYDYYTFEYDFEVDFLGDVSEKFILVATIPVTADESFEFEFEFEFEGGPDVDQLECLLNKINPACVYIIIEYIGV